jgi:hypothetical protein
MRSGVGGADPWLEQAGLRVVNKLHLGVKVRPHRASPGVGGPAPWLEQSGLRVVNKAVPWSKSPNAQSEPWCRRDGTMVGAVWSKGSKQGCTFTLE